MRHHPAVARTFYDLGPARTVRNLAAILREADRAGEVAVASLELAAEMLVGLWQGMSNYRLALGIEPEEYHVGLAEHVRRGVAVFPDGCWAKHRRIRRS